MFVSRFLIDLGEFMRQLLFIQRLQCYGPSNIRISGLAPEYTTLIVVTVEHSLFH